MQRNKLLLGLGAAAVAAGAVWMVGPKSKPDCPRMRKMQTQPAVQLGSSPVTLVDRKVAVPLQLLERQSLTHDTDRFRFALPSPEHIVGE